VLYEIQSISRYNCDKEISHIMMKIKIIYMEKTILLKYLKI